MNTVGGTASETAWRRVLDEPGSLAARQALAAAYRAEGQEQRALLIENQIAVRAAELKDDWTGPLVVKQREEVKEILAKHGREFAGPVAKLVDTYEFHRGLVARIDLVGERFLTSASALFQAAPIQHVKLKPPYGDLPAIFALFEFSKLSSLLIEHDARYPFGDAEAIALANAPNNLRYLSLWQCDVGRKGVEALAASPYFKDTVFISLTGNPCDPTPLRELWDTGGYGCPMEMNYSRPALAEELEKKFGRRPWLDLPNSELPSLDDIATTP